MSRLWHLYAFDIKKGFMENWIKIGIAVFMFLFFTNVAIKDSFIYSLYLQQETGFLGYWMMVLGGMSEYIKTDMSIFEIPVSWLLFYAYLFYLIGFYPVADLYESGTKTLLLSESRNKWIISKFLWIATMVVLYFFVFALCLLLNMWLLEAGWDLGLLEVKQMYGILQTSAGLWQMLGIWFGVPILMSVAISYFQFMVSIYTNAITGYCVSVILLVISAYWMKPFLPANYLMIMRTHLIADNGMKTADGVIFAMAILALSVITGWLIFRRKDIYKTA